MISETIINADAIMPYIYKSVILVLAIFGGCFIFNNVVNVIKDLFFKSKDTSITNNLIDKSLFTKNPKKLAQQNNAEIQELKERLVHLEQYVENMNTKIEKQLDIILREFNKRG